MNVKSILEPICSHNTDQVPASSDLSAISRVVDFAVALNEKNAV